MKLKRLKIGRRCYRVHESILPSDQYAEIQIGPPNKILLSEVLNEEDSAYALIHEVLHGIWHAKQVPTRPREERVVTDLAWGLVALFRDNPGLINHLEKLIKEAR